MELPSLRRRIFPALALTLAITLIGFVLRSAPRDQEIILVFGEGHKQLIGAEWTLCGLDGTEESGARWAWTLGRAPSQVQSHVQVTPGRWRLLVQLKTPQNTLTEERSILLEGASLRIPIQVD